MLGVLASGGRLIPGQSWAVRCPSLILPTESVLSDDRGELREIATDRYGADTLLLHVQQNFHVTRNIAALWCCAAGDLNYRCTCIATKILTEKAWLWSDPPCTHPFNNQNEDRCRAMCQLGSRISTEPRLHSGLLIATLRCSQLCFHYLCCTALCEICNGENSLYCAQMQCKKCIFE